MFRIVSERTAWWPVIFAGVSEDGTIVENRIELRFRILDEDDFPSFIAELLAMTAGDAGQVDGAGSDASAVPMTQSQRAAKVLAPVVRDWRGVGSENGEPMPFSEVAFASLLRVPNVAGAVGNAYLACRRASPEVREGN